MAEIMLLLVLLAATFLFGYFPIKKLGEFLDNHGLEKEMCGRMAAGGNEMSCKQKEKRTLHIKKGIADKTDLFGYMLAETGNSPSVFSTEKGKWRSQVVFSAGDILKSIGILLAASCIGFFFYNLGVDEANIITIYVLGVLLTAIATKNRIYSLISSAVSVLVFNFLFTDPKYTLRAYDKSYPLTFGVMFLAALITSSLVMQLKIHARQSALVAFRTRILFDMNRLLQQAKGQEELIRVTAQQLMKLLKKEIIFYPVQKGRLGDAQSFTRDHHPLDSAYLSEGERRAAEWTLKNNRHAGATTDMFPEAKCLYLAVRVNDNVYGVVGIVMEEDSLDAFENDILLSILGECALALENEKNTKEKEEAAVLAQNEQLRANLLRAISHDLRTPLTSISGNASNLLSMGSEFDEETKRQLYSDIYDDSVWLINLVENLLSITRLVEGRLNLNITEDLIEDVIAEALRHVNKNASEHSITVSCQEDFLLAKMDSRLIVQVIINLINNAIAYTPVGSHIWVEVQKSRGKIIVSVSDDGNGISEEAKQKVFDMFYSGEHKIADSRRSCGIGLSLCRSIINAHGGEITVSDKKPHGAVFTFTLPAGEVQWHE